MLGSGQKNPGGHPGHAAFWVVRLRAPNPAVVRVAYELSKMNLHRARASVVVLDGSSNNASQLAHLRLEVGGETFSRGELPHFVTPLFKGVDVVIETPDGSAEQPPALGSTALSELTNVRVTAASKAARPQRVRLDAVRAIANKHGLPHTGFTLDEELSAMLTFFHSLNSILWCALTAYQTADALVLCVLLE